MELFIVDIAKGSKESEESVRQSYHEAYLSLWDQCQDHLSLLFPKNPDNRIAMLQCLAILSVYKKHVGPPIEPSKLRVYLFDGLGIEMDHQGNNMSLFVVVTIVVSACAQETFDDFYAQVTKISPYSTTGLVAIWENVNDAPFIVQEKPQTESHTPPLELSHIRQGLDNYEKKISPKQSQSCFPFFAWLSTPSERAVNRHLYYANIFAPTDDNDPSENEIPSQQQKIALYALLTGHHGKKLKNCVFNALGYIRDSDRAFVVDALFSEVEQDIDIVNEHIIQAETDTQNTRQYDPSLR